jgi:uncharacterized membrane protein YkvA (DUF1232 family)
MWAQLKRWARELENEGMTLWFCCRHPGMPWLPRIFALLVVGYFLSPIDLIPDFIPVLGYLDDLLLVPVGIYLTLKLVPRHVIEECRVKARDWIAARQPQPKSIIAAVVITILWMLFFGMLWHYFGDSVMKLLSAA